MHIVKNAIVDHSEPGDGPLMRPFNHSDWLAFAGAEGEDDCRIAEVTVKLAGEALVPDDNGIFRLAETIVDVEAALILDDNGLEICWDVVLGGDHGGEPITEWNVWAMHCGPEDDLDRVHLECIAAAIVRLGGVARADLVRFGFDRII